MTNKNIFMINHLSNHCYKKQFPMEIKFIRMLIEFIKNCRQKYFQNCFLTKGEKLIWVLNILLKFTQSTVKVSLTY